MRVEKKKALVIFGVLSLIVITYIGFIIFPGSSRYEVQHIAHDDEYLRHESERDHDECYKTIKLIRYSWDGYGLFSSTFHCMDIVDDIIAELETIEETGEIVEKISDDVIDKDSFLYSESYPVDPGMLWLEYDDKIYRFPFDLSQMCCVETHFGAGVILKPSEELIRNIQVLWAYKGSNYYRGYYCKGSKTIDIFHEFSAESNIQLEVKEMCVEQSDAPYNYITVELTAQEDMKIDISLVCRASIDNYSGGDKKTVSLKKNVPKKVKLTFGGWENFAYEIYISMPSYQLEITIDPIGHESEN